MANVKTDSNGQVVRVPKKADVILKHSRQISAKTDEIISQSKLSNARLDEVLEQLGRSRQDVAHTTRQSGEIYNSLREEYLSIKQEMKYLAMQSENIFATISEKLAALSEDIEKIKGGVPMIASDETAVAAVEPVEKTEPVREVVREVPSSVVVSAEIDYDMLADKVIERLPEKETVVAGAPEIDYDKLAEKVAERMPEPRVAAVAAESEPLDYELLADKLVERIPVQENLSAEYIANKVVEYMPVTSGQEVVREVVAAPQVTEIDYDLLSEKVAAKMPARETAVAAVAADIDCESLADRIAARLSVQETVSPDYIASKVAEQIIIPQSAEVDYETIADKVAERIPATERAFVAAAPVESVVEIDYDLLAEKVAAHMPETAATVVSADAPVNVELDEEELADRIALKVGSLKSEDFDILVDEEGCESISRTLADKLDYDIISATVAEKLRAALDYMTGTEEPDYEEMAARISEKITVAGVNEDAIADKAAAVLSNYLPEIDTDEIADKVAEQVINAMPAVDNEYISTSVSEKVIASQADNDYDIVIDEEGLDRITETVYEKVVATSGERFNAIDDELSEIKGMLVSGAVIREVAVAGEALAYEEPYVAEESLVTVSDIVEAYEEENEEQIEETAEEPVEETEEAVEEETEEEPEEQEEVIEETVEPEEEPVEEVAEPEEEPLAEEPEEVTETEDEEGQPVEEAPEENIVEETEAQANEEDDSDEDDGDIEEFTLGDLTAEGDEEVAAGGVDFLNMMKYNRSFIARIIQGTDEQKVYYGEVRNALLSYKKVNSNIAWGAERFHKGRETIARFKIRGKTLVVYLALDPATHEYSVYHHKDVSDNKSLHGTPMMIKVKSPRGVKKALRLIDEMLEARGGIKRNIPKRDYAAMYPFETIEELIEDGLVKEVKKN